jgi:hypothetical protein
MAARDARQVLAKARTNISTQVMYRGRYGRQSVWGGYSLPSERTSCFIVLCAVHVADGLEADSSTKRNEFFV